MKKLPLTNKRSCDTMSNTTPVTGGNIFEEEFQMNIFYILGQVLDSFVLNGESKFKENDGTVNIESDDVHMVYTCAMNFDVDTDEEWNKVVLTFRKNPDCGKGELNWITFYNLATGDYKVYEIGNLILENISESGLGSLYFKICENIML